MTMGEYLGKVDTQHGHDRYSFSTGHLGYVDNIKTDIGTTNSFNSVTDLAEAVLSSEGISTSSGYSIKVVQGDIVATMPSNETISLNSKETKEMINKDAKIRLVPTNRGLYARLCKQGREVGTNYIMPDIKDVRILTNGDENTGVAVTFADNTTMKAILNRDEHDVFSLEQGISICITKKLLAMKSMNGESLYNKIVNRAKKVYTNRVNEERLQLEREEAQAKKREKIAQKNRAWWEKKRNKQREEQIEIQKEAYIRAMRELNTASGEVAAE